MKPPALENKRPLIEGRELCYSYSNSPDDNGQAAVLNRANLTISGSGITALVGASGAGKTTLLHLLCGLLPLSSGELHVCGCDVSSASEYELAQLRSRLGLVFQDYRLLEDKRLIDNVMLPLYFSNCELAAGRCQAASLIKTLGLQGLENRLVCQLSGGQKQRASLARALITSPQLLLADEPLGHLDAKNAQIILELLQQLQAEHALGEHALGIVLTTHDQNLATQCSQVLQISEGKIYTR